MYARLQTRDVSGLHPNLRGGLGGYGLLSTRNSSGLRPGLRGLGDVGPTQFTIGPGGQWSISTASNATSQSIGDQITNWLGGSTVMSGVPNSVVAIAGIAALIFFARKRTRR